MEPSPCVSFGHFQLDTANQSLWRGRCGIPLAPKQFAVLCFLVERAGRLVTKDELRQAVWDDPLASDASLKVCIGGIRKALGDRSQKPKIIATVHRRGYRFIATVSLKSSSHSPRGDGNKSLARCDGSASRLPMVGRESDLAQLEHFLYRAIQGSRQVVFITGESGIGKTMLVEALLEIVSQSQLAWTASGQCFQHHMSCEAYQPVLEAIGRLAQQPGGERLIAILARYAPTWFAQLPAIGNPASRNTPGASGRMAELDRDSAALANSQARMLREIDDALTAFTAATPLVLVLEDVQTCDFATLDLISLLARRHDRGKLLLIATYRPADAIISGHPLTSLKQDLLTHSQCQEIALTSLSEVAVGDYVRAKFPGNGFPVELPRLVHEHTNGHPFSMGKLLQHLQDQQVFIDADPHWVFAHRIAEATTALPESIRQLFRETVDQQAPVTLVATAESTSPPPHVSRRTL